MWKLHNVCHTIRDSLLLVFFGLFVCFQCKTNKEMVWHTHTPKDNKEKGDDFSHTIEAQRTRSNPQPFPPKRRVWACTAAHLFSLLPCVASLLLLPFCNYNTVSRPLFLSSLLRKKSGESLYLSVSLGPCPRFGLVGCESHNQPERERAKKLHRLAAAADWWEFVLKAKQKLRTKETIGGVLLLSIACERSAPNVSRKRGLWCIAFARKSNNIHTTNVVDPCCFLTCCLCFALAHTHTHIKSATQESAQRLSIPTSNLFMCYREHPAFSFFFHSFFGENKKKENY